MKCVGIKSLRASTTGSNRSETFISEENVKKEIHLSAHFKLQLFKLCMRVRACARAFVCFCVLYMFVEPIRVRKSK